MELDADALLEAAKSAKADGPDAVLDVLSDLIESARNDEERAIMLIWILDRWVLPHEQTAETFAVLLAVHAASDRVAIAMGQSMEAARDLDDLNAAPPDAPIFRDLLRRLREIDLANNDPDRTPAILRAIATTARLMGRQEDTTAERAYMRLAEIAPDDHTAHYVHGLYCKTRGRFRQGIDANRRALALDPEGGTDAARWNLGICATGAGDGQTALEIWRGMGNKIELAESGLPEGSYPACKVRIAQRPLAERTADSDDPGIEESIWIQRLSPCHGIVRSVVYAPELGTDYGDTILFDGAPITHHLYGERKIPVFPHLATLSRGNFHFYDFSATQREGNAVDTANDQLDADLYIYSHTSYMTTLCATCWRDESVQHERHEAVDHQVIHGRIAIHPDIPAADALARIDAIYAGLPGARILAPDLCLAAGESDRSELELPRYTELRGG